jgi:lysophospholipase L1-like esterase
MRNLSRELVNLSDMGKVLEVAIIASARRNIAWGWVAVVIAVASGLGYLMLAPAAQAAASGPQPGKWTATAPGGATVTFDVQRVHGGWVVDHYVSFCAGMDGYPMSENFDLPWQSFDAEPKTLAGEVFRIAANGDFVLPHEGPDAWGRYLTSRLSRRTGTIREQYPTSSGGYSDLPSGTLPMCPSPRVPGSPLNYTTLHAHPVAHSTPITDGSWLLQGPNGSYADISVGGSGRLISIWFYVVNGPADIPDPVQEFGPLSCTAGRGSGPSDGDNMAVLVSNRGSFRAVDEEPGGATDKATFTGSFTSPTVASGTMVVSMSNSGYGQPCRVSMPFTATLQAPALALSAALPGPPPTRNYVALGDSFSSGEGADDYRGGRCHRSTNAYPELLARASTLQTGYAVKLVFAACSGATTADLLDRPQHRDPPQTRRLGAKTSLVTVTIGGNDAGFGDILLGCLRHQVRALGKILLRKLTTVGCTAEGARRRVDALGPILLHTYREIRARAPRAAVWVLDYPTLFPSTPVEQRCRTLRPLFTPASQRILNQAALDLDGLIQKEAKAAHVQFIDVDGEFTGHQICTPQPWVNSVTRGNPAGSFHPNVTGQRAYGVAAQQYLTDTLFEGGPRTSTGLPANP